MKRFFSIILLLSVAFSCKKGQSDLSIAITLSNTSYGGQVEGATVSVKKVVSGTGDVVSVGPYTSNSSGQVVFSTKRDKFDYLIVQIEKSNFFSVEQNIYMSDLNTNDVNSINYNLVGKSWAAIHLKATGPSSVNIQKNGGKSGCEECCPSVMTYFAGPIDTTFYCINDANTTYSFIYFINGGVNSGEKSGITNFADTTELLLEF